MFATRTHTQIYTCMYMLQATTSTIINSFSIRFPPSFIPPAFRYPLLSFRWIAAALLAFLHPSLSPSLHHHPLSLIYPSIPPSSARQHPNVQPNRFWMLFSLIRSRPRKQTRRRLIACLGFTVTRARPHTYTQSHAHTNTGRRTHRRVAVPTLCFYCIAACYSEGEGTAPSQSGHVTL